MIIKEMYNVGNDVAEITKCDDKYNPYVVDIKISFADYKSARLYIEQSGFNTAFKQIIKEGEE
jgi:hypothetical protein